VTPVSTAIPLGPLTDNHGIAARLDEVARLLALQKANEFRVRAYRNGAATLRRLDRPVVEIYEREGLEGLDRLPTIGPALANAIRELLTTGRLTMLERLRGESDPVTLLASVPGVGRGLAERLYDDFQIETLEQLEAAAHDGTLATVPGFGAKRLAGIREALATRLGRVRRAPVNAQAEPAIADLLDVDREYRERAAAGELPTIAPRRFNLSGEAWLPILHTSRGPWHFTVLFSNTARAHELGKTRDWVVLYFDGGDGERQRTVITAGSGSLKGQRVVRGREAETEAFHRERGAPLDLFAGMP
jgi:hypothetical protein